MKKLSLTISMLLLFVSFYAQEESKDLGEETLNRVYISYSTSSPTGDFGDTDGTKSRVLQNQEGTLT